MKNPIQKLVQNKPLSEAPESVKQAYEELLGRVERPTIAVQVKITEAKIECDRYAVLPPAAFQEDWCNTEQKKNNGGVVNGVEVIPYISCKKHIVVTLKVTEGDAILMAEKLLPFFIELLESDPELANKISLQVWFKELQISYGNEAIFKVFAYNVTREFAIFGSDAMDTVLKSYLSDIDANVKIRMALYSSYPMISVNRSTCHCVYNAADRDFDKEFFESLSVEYPAEIERLVTFLFRKTLYERLLDGIGNFKIYPKDR